MIIHFDFLDKKANELINKYSSSSRFDLKEFELWIDFNGVREKDNPSAYVNKCFLSELENGTFEKKKVVANKGDLSINLQPLFEDMRGNGIIVNQNDTIYLEVFFEFLIENKILTIEEIKRNNHEDMKYIIAHGLKSSTNFIELFKKSKALNGKKIDYSFIEKEYEKRLKEWDEILKELKSPEVSQIKMPWDN